MVVVAQLGARMHYAVPAILARSGMLDRLYTDIYAPRLPGQLRAVASRYGPAPLRRWLGRVPADVPKEKIVAFSKLGIEYYRRRKGATSRGSVTAVDIWAGQELCRRAIHRGLGNARSVYTFNSAGLELLQYAQSHGVQRVTEQTSSPSAIFQEILAQEHKEYQQWTLFRGLDPLQPAFEERERLEWDTANLILCASEFVREGIRAIGGPVERCRVVPYGVRPRTSNGLRDQRHTPLRVLTVGAVQMMKGAQYVLMAARSLKRKAEFRMVGKLDITADPQNMLREHVMLLGAVPRTEVHQQFAWADVFLLPTLCEGSATVCYEALSHGLPVITTPNAGSVVRDGVDGFIVPIRDARAIVDRVERLLDDGDLWARMSASALARASEYTLESYGERLLSALGSAGLMEN